MSNLKHGKARTQIYLIWRAMRSRCSNPKDRSFKNYGARGITVSHEWKSFENFYRDMGEKPEGKTLDRINNNLGYSKENCVWSSRKQQSRNRRNRRHLTCNGVTKTMAEWAEEIGISIPTIWNRVKLGWSDQEAVSIPLVKRRAGIPAGEKLRNYQHDQS